MVWSSSGDEYFCDYRLVKFPIEDGPSYGYEVRLVHVEYEYREPIAWHEVYPVFVDDVDLDGEFDTDKILNLYQERLEERVLKARQALEKPILDSSIFNETD